MTTVTAFKNGDQVTYTVKYHREVIGAMGIITQSESLSSASGTYLVDFEGASWKYWCSGDNLILSQPITGLGDDDSDCV